MREAAPVRHLLRRTSALFGHAAALPVGQLREATS